MTSARACPEPRIQPVTDPGPEIAEALSRTLLRPGQTPLNIFRTLAVHPRLLRRVNQLTGTLIGGGTIPARERELVILRVAARVDCEYERHQHHPLARAAGLTDDEIAALGPAAPARTWPPGDQHLIAMTDELIDSDDISDPTWAALRSRWDDAQLVELVLLVGCYRMMAGLMRALRVTIDVPATDVRGTDARGTDA